MRAVCLFLLLALAACTSLARQNGDYFEAGRDPGRFEADDAACTTRAQDYAAYDLRGMSGTHYAQNRSYNAVYGRCMRERGYRPRAYVENWLP